MKNMTDNRPLDIQQREALIAAYKQHGCNVGKAAREVGVSRRTAYLWISRFEMQGESGLQPRSHARKTHPQKRKAIDALVGRVRAVKEGDPALTARGIAERLGQEDGIEVNKSTVHAVLQALGISGRAIPAKPVPLFLSPLARILDVNALWHDMQAGIVLDVSDRPVEAVKVLWGAVWSPIRRAGGKTAVDRILRDERIGRVVLRSGLQLGHSLMNTGDWGQAAIFFRLVKDWIVEHETFGDRYDAQDLPVSLRYDDMLIECWLYLAIVLRDTNRREAQTSLDTAIFRMNTAYKPIVPTDHRRARGELHRGRANLLLRLSGGRNASIGEDLRIGAECLGPTDDPGWHAALHLTHAQLCHTRGLSVRSSDPAESVRQREAMVAAIDPLPSPILRTKFFTDAARLKLEWGMTGDVNRDQVREAARQSIRYGYGGQAQSLLAIAEHGDWLSEPEIVALRAVAPTT